MPRAAQNSVRAKSRLVEPPDATAFSFTFQPAACAAVKTAQDLRQAAPAR